MQPLGSPHTPWLWGSCVEQFCADSQLSAHRNGTCGSTDPVSSAQSGNSGAWQKQITLESNWDGNEKANKQKAFTFVLCYQPIFYCQADEVPRCLLLLLQQTKKFQHEDEWHLLTSLQQALPWNALTGILAGGRPGPAAPCSHDNGSNRCERGYFPERKSPKLSWDLRTKQTDE